MDAIRGEGLRKLGVPEQGGAPLNGSARPLTDWRAELLDKVRRMILAADMDIVETVKWRKPSNPAGVPVWEADGIVCTGETYKDKVKLTFAQGAKLEDAAELFNAGLDGNVRRAIDLGPDSDLDEAAFRALIREAVALNKAK